MDEVPARDHHLVQGMSPARLILLSGDALDESPAGEGGSATAEGSEETDPGQRDFIEDVPAERRKLTGTDQEILIAKDNRR